MKNSTLLSFVIALCLSITMCSCTAIGDIFKTGVGVGIFIVVFIIVLIGGIAIAMRKK